MIFQPRKAALYRLAIEHGIRTPEEIDAHLPLGSSVPRGELNGWLQQLLRAPKTFSSRRRYVNRFKIGADPEFVFGNTQRDANGGLVGSARVDASAVGFAQGPAFGADNNGRLAEIRPYPSRSAVEVVASILCTLRWMALLNPQTLRYDWHAGAYLWDDGIGGHVHFGRKRPTRKEEVTSLDHVEEVLVHLGVFPKDQVIRRRGGDARRQVYGALGDFRMQQHGYEYRTFPSWLDSPELAFFTLVVAKLAVQVPSLYRFKGADPAFEQARLRNFLAYFKGVDDDARLALILLDRGIPQHQRGNFAPNWGITLADLANRKPPHIEVVPPCIKPDTTSVQEVFDCLLGGRRPAFRVPDITWKPTVAPSGYKMCLTRTNTIQAKGLGEMIWDMCFHVAMPVSITTGHRGELGNTKTALRISKQFASCLPANWKERFEGRARMDDLRAETIVTTPEWREGAQGVWLRKALLNGVLPIWKVSDCKEGAYEAWRECAKEHSKQQHKFAGRIEFESEPFAKMLKLA